MDLTCQASCIISMRKNSGIFCSLIIVVNCRTGHEYRIWICELVQCIDSNYFVVFVSSTSGLCAIIE